MGSDELVQICNWQIQQSGIYSGCSSLPVAGMEHLLEAKTVGSATKPRPAQLILMASSQTAHKK